MRKTIGILAHVDAGKTTFSERVLYLTSAIRQLGRVDHQNAFLDAHPMERQRGITIFSGQAVFNWQGDTYYWLDTPGHVDFAAEMERAVAVMDYAVLIISCAEGVQSHTHTVWQLLKEHQVPVFIFLNKIDRAGADPERVLAQIRKELSPEALDLRSLQMTGQMDDVLIEEVAQRDEELLEALFDTGYDQARWMAALPRLISHRQVFPVMAGSALEGVGVEEFLNLLGNLTPTQHNEVVPLTSRVYQVRHDPQGQRIVFMKLLSGSLSVKEELPQGKVNEIRVYHGEKYKTQDRAAAGDLIAVPGLEGLKPGDGVNLEERTAFQMEPMMESQVLWDEKAIPPFKMMQALRILEEEEPALAVSEQRGKISVRVMGKIQLEILRQLLMERWQYPASFGPTQVLYKETVAAPAIGIGHYEPLKHYAEVHLRLKPGKPGSGVTFRSLCHVDTLALTWQKLICSHVFERQHKGVLIGAPLTDVEVELLTGRAHLKHTEGGDFRQAVYRALRNALMHAQSVLLEPMCGFSLKAPADQYGSLASALTRLQADVQPPEYDEDTVTLSGTAFYSRFAPWQEDFLRLTHGRGILRVWMARYAPSPDPQPVIDAAQYNPLADDSPDSVFCQKGAGFNVPWDQVKDWAHLHWEE